MLSLNSELWFLKSKWTRGFASPSPGMGCQSITGFLPAFLPGCPTINIICCYPCLLLLSRSDVESLIVILKIQHMGSQSPGFKSGCKENQFSTSPGLYIVHDFLWMLVQVACLSPQSAGERFNAQKIAFLSKSLLCIIVEGL